MHSSGAERDYHIARLHPLANQLRRILKSANVVRILVPVASDCLGQGFGGHARDRLFTGRIDVGYQQRVGVIERARELAHQVIRARIAVRLEQHYCAPAARSNLGRSQRRPDLGRMMAVVVNYHDSVDFTLDLEAPAGPGKRAQRFGDLFKQPTAIAASEL